MIGLWSQAGRWAAFAGAMVVAVAAAVLVLIQRGRRVGDAILDLQTRGIK